MIDRNQVNVIEHPLLDNSLTYLRSIETRTASFRQHAAIVSSILLVEATRMTVKKYDRQVETPLAPYMGSEISNKVVLIPVLRAGLAMLDAAQKLLPNVPVGFLGLERDEETAVAREYYRKFPGTLDDYRVIILDPMLATGGSLEGTIEAVNKRGGKDITLVCVVAAPEGIDRVLSAHPEATLYTGAIDSHLNEQKYIVPGLGDFGDRYFGT